MSELTQLPPHSNMSPDECLKYCCRNADDYQDVIVLGYDQDGNLTVRSSRMSRQEAAWLLMLALDHARGVIRE